MFRKKENGMTAEQRLCLIHRMSVLGQIAGSTSDQSGAIKTMQQCLREIMEFTSLYKYETHPSWMK